jgi:hypothetical protein
MFATLCLIQSETNMFVFLALSLHVRSLGPHFRPQSSPNFIVTLNHDLILDALGSVSCQAGEIGTLRSALRRPCTLHFLIIFIFRVHHPMKMLIYNSCDILQYANVFSLARQIQGHWQHRLLQS